MANTITINVGQTFPISQWQELDQNGNPLDPQDETYTLQSTNNSDPAVASFTPDASGDGPVTGLSAGTTTITCVAQSPTAVNPTITGTAVVTVLAVVTLVATSLSPIFGPVS